MHNSGFTHMVLWVAPDQSIPWSDVWEETYPNLSKESREWIGSKGAVLSNKLYTAYTTYVTGFSHAGEDVVNYIATYNLIKAESGKLSDYIEFEKNMKTTLEKHAPKLKGWHALTRNGSVARAQGAWDFMTIDNFANAQDANQLWWTDIPQKIRQNNSKKLKNFFKLCRNKFIFNYFNFIMFNNNNFFSICSTSYFINTLSFPNYRGSENVRL